MPEYLGAYRLDSRLGRGGMGEVFLAWDERLERRVAIKRVRRDVFEASHHRDRFRREARMAARLSHAAIVQIHDLVTDGSGDAIVMEYVEGVTLAERMAHGLLETAEAVRLAREIAEGLAAAHAAGLIHRDLKAENVVVTPAGHAKILDFGLARPVAVEDQRLTGHGAIVGTCYAMSPEQASGEELDERSDLFSFGALLYEMLTGRSPFRAKDSLNTLKRILTEQPPPLASVRPGVPAGLASLVDRLLAKDRRERPGSAEQVARRLERIEREMLREKGEPGPEGMSTDHPTAAFPVVPWTRPSEAAAPLPTRGWARLRVRRRVLPLVGLLVIAAGMVSFLLARRASEPPPLRILVLKPQVDAEDGGLALTASAVQSAALSGLGTLQGIAPLDPTLVWGPVDSPQQAARNVAADEVLVSEVVREGERARVSLRRVEAEGGEVLWSDSWVVPTGTGGLSLLKDMVDGRLRQAFAGFPPRPGAPPWLQVRGEDYSAFLEVRQRIDSGRSPSVRDLDQLGRIVRGSPRFLEGWLQGAKLAIELFRSTHDPADLERARWFVEGARKIAPGDVRTLRESFHIALDEGRTEEAATILSRLEGQIPGDPDLLLLKYRLLENRGRTEAAGETLRAAVEQAPSWRNVLWLARFEARRGRVQQARRLIERLLGESPGNVWAREELAYLELFSGDLQRARQIYGELVRSDSRPWYFTNIGLAFSFERRHMEAREAYLLALSYSYGDIVATLNFADVELTLGNQAAAQALYGSVLRTLKDNEPASGPTPEDRLVEAQCLARLGMADEAREAVRLAMRQQPDDPQLLYKASLVHALLGDHETSLAFARSALDDDLSPRWFSVSAFDELRTEPGLQDLLGSSFR